MNAYMDGWIMGNGGACTGEREISVFETADQNGVMYKENKRAALEQILETALLMEISVLHTQCLCGNSNRKLPLNETQQQHKL